MLPSRVHALESGDDRRSCRRRDRGACAARRSRGCAPWCTRCRSACAPGRRCSCAPCRPISLQRDREQADRHLLAGRGDDVELARIGVRPTAPSASASRRLVSPVIAETTTTSWWPCAVEARDAARDVPDALGRCRPTCRRISGRSGPCGASARQSARNASVALVPPKPNEFDSAARIVILRATQRHEIEIALRIASNEVRRRRRDLVAHREHGEHRLDAAGRAEQVAGHRLGRRHGELVRVVAERALDRDAFGDVAERRRRAVRVDVVDVGRRHRRRCAAR